MRFDRHLVIGCAAALALAFSTAPANAASQYPGHDKVVAAIKADQAAAIERLRAWIALPTIANMGVNTPQGAEYMRQLALDAGFQQAKVVESGGVPGVFATLDAGAKHTLAVYFMYDVKHYDPAEWSSPPLEGRIVERPGEGQALVGRGAVNQKGPQMAFLTALHAFKDAGVKLPVNLVLVAEGEEEIGSTNFPTLLADPEIKAALQRSVGVMMPSTGQSRDGSVSLDLGAKGVIEVQLVSSGEKWGRGPAKDIHSSLMARVDSPAWHLVKALDTLVADDGFTPTVDGWFENVRPLTPREKELLAASLPKDEEAVKKTAGRAPLDQGRGLSHQHLSPRLAADGQHPGPRQRLHRAGRQDRAPRPCRGQAGLPPRPRHDQGQRRSRSSRRISRSAVSATSR